MNDYWITFSFLWRNSPTGVLASSFFRFRDHTQWHNTVGRTPLGEWSAHRRDLYLTTHNTQNRHTFMLKGGIRSRNPRKRAAADPRLRSLVTEIGAEWRLLHTIQSNPIRSPIYSRRIACTLSDFFVRSCHCSRDRRLVQHGAISVHVSKNGASSHDAIVAPKFPPKRRILVEKVVKGKEKVYPFSIIKKNWTLTISKIFLRMNETMFFRIAEHG